MRAGDGGKRYASRDSTTLLAALITTLGVAVLYLTNAAAGGSFALRGLPLDDAWIHQVYARSAALGRPFQYNPGEWETGSTSPLWSLLLAPGHWMGAPVAFAKALGVLCVAAAAFVGARLVRRFAGNGAALGFAVALPLLPHVSFAAVSGMEVGLILLLTLLTAECALGRRWTRAALFAGLAILARPEASILLPLLCLSIFLRTDRAAASAGWKSEVATAHRNSRNDAARTVLVAAVVTLPWLMYCLVVSGRPLPATVYAKSSWLLPSLLHQLRVLAGSLGFQPLLGFSFGDAWLQAISGVLGIVAMVLGARRVLREGGKSSLALVAGFPALYMAGLLFAVPLGSPLPPDRPGSALNFYFARYLVPALPLLLALWVAGISEIAQLVSARASSRDIPRKDSKDSKDPVDRAFLSSFAVLSNDGSKWRLLALLPLLALPVASTMQALPRLASIYSWNCRNIEDQQVAAGRWIDANVPPNQSVWVSDAGAIRYFGNHRVVDLVGLNAHRLLPLVQAAEAAPRESAEQIALRDRFWSEEQPTWFAITRGWHGALLAGKMVELEHSIEIENNTICAGSEILILKAAR